jgi:hypothetical protein
LAGEIIVKRVLSRGNMKNIFEPVGHPAPARYSVIPSVLHVAQTGVRLCDTISSRPYTNHHCIICTRVPKVVSITRKIIAYSLYSMNVPGEVSAARVPHNNDNDGNNIRTVAMSCGNRGIALHSSAAVPNPWAESRVVQGRELAYYINITYIYF